MKAWYFSKTDCKLRYNDNRIIKAGVNHTVDCKPVMCKQGLHASINIMDALEYAPGPYVWRVNLSGEVIKGDDKCVATHREYLWGFDATELLRKHARMSALDVLHLWDAPDVVARYLKTGDESIRAAAWDAAWYAAWYAAGDAARAAAWDAAWAAARAAAWYAAWDAAGAAAGYAAWAAAWAAARDKQSKRLYRMVIEEHRK
jgi:hypothetical protein